MAQTIRIDYRPTPKQQLFHASPAHEVLYGGAAGGGKTKALLMDSLMRALQTPGYHAYLFRRTYRELEDSLIKEANASIPAALGRYISSTHDMRLTNGSVLHFRHCQFESDVYLYQGTEMDELCIDELTHFTKPMYDYLCTRLRTKTTKGITPVVRCASNPGNIGHGWVKDRFVDAGEYAKIHERIVRSAVLREEQVRTLQYIPALATENPYITKDYIFQLEQKPEALRRALLQGDWDAFEGQVFTEFINAPSHYHDRLFTHVIAPFEIPANWTRYRSFDYGYSKPFSVGWWAVSPDDVVYRYKELYGSNGEPNVGLRIHPRELAQRILAMEEDERREGIQITGIADPAIWDGSRGESIAEQMQREGVYFSRGDNARLAGKMQVHYRLAMVEDGQPRLQVFDTCKDWIRTVPNLAYDPRKPEDVDSDGEDHIYDEMRYFLMQRPVAPVIAASRPRLLFDPLDQDPSKSQGRRW